MSDSVVLFTPYFRARSPERQRELDFCLERNLGTPGLDRLVLLVDDGHRPATKDPRVSIVDLDHRPTYADWVRLTREMEILGISLLANSDIHFDASLPSVHEVLREPQSFLALSRHELEGDALRPHPNPHWSQDTWGLHTRSTLHPGLLRGLDFPLGVPRCDNKVAYQFAVYGWSVHNPQRFLQSVHVHETQERHYDKTADMTVVGAVAYVHPGDSLQAPARLDLDIWALNAHAISSVSVNKSLDQWARDRNGSTGEPPLRNLKQVPATTTPAQVRGNSADLKVDWARFVADGSLLFSHNRRFELYALGESCLALDWLAPDQAQMQPLGETGRFNDVEQIISAFVPPNLDTHPIQTADRPRAPDDVHFWQYPAATERQAHQNHASIATGSHLDPASRTVHTYLGLPWATYIDHELWKATRLPAELVQAISVRVRGLRHLTRALGWRLRVHTVCQHIRWRTLSDRLAEIGITDLHLSHATHDIDPSREGWPFTVHSWPLIAPNIEDPARREGLLIGKPPANRKYLASFVGAHMKHYRSNVRERLAEAARASGRPDVRVEISGLWHFNHLVYKEQVNRKSQSREEVDSERAATRQYNEVLSDSVFSLCPEGAGPNTLRIWESLAVGAIPVILADGWVPPEMAPQDPALEDCCVFVPVSEVASLISRLAAMPAAQVEAMHEAAMLAYPALRSRRAFGKGAT